MAAPVSMSSCSANTGKPAHRARRVDLGDLLAGHPAQGIEVVDRGVPEQPARDRDVRVGRRLVVVGDQPDEVHRPELAALDQSPRLDVGRVEAPLEPDLDDRPGGLGLVDERDRLLEVERERLLDEDRQAGVDRPARRAWRGRSSRPRRCTASAALERLVDGRGDAPADLASRVAAARSGSTSCDDDLVDARLLGHEPPVQLRRSGPPRGARSAPGQPARTSGLGRTMSRIMPCRSWYEATKPRRVRADRAVRRELVDREAVGLVRALEVRDPAQQVVDDRGVDRHVDPRHRVDPALVEPHLPRVRHRQHDVAADELGPVEPVAVGGGEQPGAVAPLLVDAVRALEHGDARPVGGVGVAGRRRRARRGPSSSRRAARPSSSTPG